MPFIATSLRRPVIAAQADRDGHILKCQADTNLGGHCPIQSGVSSDSVWGCLYTHTPKCITGHSEEEPQALRSEDIPAHLCAAQGATLSSPRGCQSLLPAPFPAIALAPAPHSGDARHPGHLRGNRTPLNIETVSAEMMPTMVFISLATQHPRRLWGGQDPQLRPGLPNQKRCLSRPSGNPRHVEV